MSQPGIQDDDGSFNRQLRDEIEQRIEDEAKNQFGENVDLSQGSPIKQLIDVVILEHEYIWQILEEVYYSAYYGHAYEEQLDKIMELTQFERIPRRGATGEVTFSVQVANNEDVVIPEGTRVATYETDDRPSIPFKTTEPARLPAGSAQISNVPIRAAEPWEADLDPEWLGEETNVGAQTIEKFETPVGGVDRVTNPYPTGDSSREHGYSYINGRDRETDEEFRRRYEANFGAEASASLDALRSSMLSINGIRNADVEENTDMTEDEAGRPPKSIHITLLGDAHVDDIAQEIVETRSAGIESYGADSGIGTTRDGKEREESFDWATEIGTYVSVEVTHDGENFPNDGALRVENSIIEYIGGETVEGEQYPGTGMGEDVIYDLVYKAAMSVPGVYRANVDIGDDPGMMGKHDIVVEGLETAMTAANDVDIFTRQEERP